MQTLASALSGQAESTIRVAETILTALVSTHRLRGRTDESLRELNEIAKTQVQKLGELDGLFMSDAEGHYFLTTNATELALNNADRAYFQHHRNSGDPALFIGQPVKSKTTGKWVITMSVGLHDSGGKFEGVALATLNVDRFVELYKSFPLGDGGVVVMAKRDGTILARSESNAETYITNISQSPMLQMANQGVLRGSVTLTAIVDKVRRIYGFDVSQKYPVLVAVAMPEEEALVAWKTRAWVMWGFALIAVLIVGVMGALVLRAFSKQSTMAIELHAARELLAGANKTLETLAFEDGLTGLANRRRLDNWLANTFEQAVAQRTSLAVVLIDVDYFKLYNDSYGHLIGDRALTEVSRVMRALARRDTDLAARYGGEEIAVILSGVTAEQALAIAEKGRRSVEELAIEHQQSPYQHVTVSIGVAAGTVGSDFMRAEEMVAAADQALYEAKHQGRNKVVLGRVGVSR
jgi:diguanylate cyclase (GGDEF)-like protein